MVNYTREKQSIPTYVPEKAIKLPMFFEHKPYQGASGRLYPLPFEDDIVKTNLLNGYTLKAYALLGLGKFNEAVKLINMAREIQKYEFPVYAFEKIFKTIVY